MLAYQHPVLSNTASDAEMEFSRDSGGGRPPLTPKFTNPETGDTWSGRGPYPPQWVKSVMDARGWTLEDFKGSDEFLSKAPGKY
ncbi:MAG: H-NS family nucleoid-associated regulatory protein [Methylocystis sp.]|uniref:H-NS family nucleoid-associated regulatory protein n=1 Tax=Methylocystis sp. TaxID=1911079 RepID=UPI003DA4DB1D